MGRGGRRPVVLLHRSPGYCGPAYTGAICPWLQGWPCSTCSAAWLANARLRWPNDVLIGKSKLAGILVERPSAHMAVIGMGINIFNDVASIAGEIKDPPARLADLVQDCPSLHDVMASLGRHLDQVFSTFAHGGIPTLQEGLAQAWAGERPVSILTDDETIRGIFTGIDDQGNPVVSLPTGSLRTVPAHLINRLVEEQA